MPLVTESYLVDRDCVHYEGLRREESRLTFLARWSHRGPEGLGGMVACEGQFSFDNDMTRLLLKLENGVEVDSDIVQHMCQAYFVRGPVEVEAINVRHVQHLGVVKVR